MEDALYILIGIAWVAYSIYSYNQKAKKQQAAKHSIPKNEYNSSDLETQTQEKQSSLKNIISEIQSYSKQEFDSSPYYSYENESDFSETKLDSIENISSVEDVIESNSPLSKEMTNQYLVENLEKEKSNENTNISEIIEKNTDTEFDFDLKKAIIYSEILKRPEY